MSLFSSIQLAGNTLHATQIGMQVVGQNIANANTPGYIREEAVFEPGPTQRIGNLVLGLGVDVSGIVQKLDPFLLDRLQSARSDRASSEIQQQSYRQLEGIIGELSDTDLSTSISNFFASIEEVLNQPESIAIRHLAVLSGDALTDDIRRLRQQVQQQRQDTDDRVEALATDINRLTEEIATLNLRIKTTEGGAGRQSDAGALRDQRNTAIGRLAEIVDIRANEQPSGSVNVSVGGEYLVFEDRRREVEVGLSTDRGVTISTVQFVETESALITRAGELTGYYEARDTILGGYLDGLDAFTQELISQFNQAYSQGQGLVGFAEAQSEFAVEDADVALDAAGLPFTPVNGSFDLLVQDTDTGLTTTHTVLVDLNGLDQDTTLNDLAATLNAIDGIAASVTTTNRLDVQTDSPDVQFAFDGDTSGLLAALGLNTFFSGTSAVDIGVRQELFADAGKFAASRGGIANDTENAIRLAAFFDESLESLGGETLSDTYDQLINSVAQGSATTAAVAEGFQTFETTLEQNHLALTGVNLDEEAIKLIGLQRTYQASARFIRTLSDLLELLVSI